MADPVTLQAAFWVSVNVLLLLIGLWLLPRRLGNLFDGRVSASAALLVAFAVYNTPWAVDYLLGIVEKGDLPSGLFPAMQIGTIAFGAMLIALVAVRLIQPTYRAPKPACFQPCHQRRLLITASVLAFSGLALTHIGARSVGGLFGYLSMSRAERYVFLSTRFEVIGYGNYLMIAAGIITALVVVTYFYRLWQSDVRVKGLVVSLALLFSTLTFFFLLGNRRFILGILLVLAVTYTRFASRVRPLLILIALAIVVPLLILAGILRFWTVATFDPQVAKEVFGERWAALKMVSLSRNDPGIVQEATANIYSRFSDGAPLLLGESYAAGFVRAIPGPLRMGVERPESIGEWYTRTMAQSVMPGTKVAISPIAESYANFGLWGVVAFHFMLMFLILLMELRASWSVLSAMLSIVVICITAYIVRSESSLFPREFIYVLGVLLLFASAIYGPGLFRGRSPASPESKAERLLPASPQLPAE